MLLSTLFVVSAFTSSTFALIYGADSATLVSEATYAKAISEGFTKAIIRGYEEACGVGGEVDPNFVPSYKNARAAGYTNIDTYWFPCNGVGHNCKSYATQLSELAATFRANSMNIGTIWIDIEKDSAICNNVRLNDSCCSEHIRRRHVFSVELRSGWQSCTGQAAHRRYQSIWIQIRNLQQSWSEAVCFICLRLLKLVHPQEWSTVFGSTSVVLDNSAPLWFATYNNVQVRELLVNLAKKVILISYHPRHSNWELLSEGKCWDIVLTHCDI